MAMTPDPQGGEKLREHVGAGPADQALCERKYAEAFELVRAYVGDADVPEAVLSEAVLEVGAKLYDRRANPNARDQYGDAGSPPVIAPRDPMVTVYPTLGRFVVGGMA